MSEIVALIHATVRLEQALGDGRRTVGTAFLVAVHPDAEPPRTMLVTANHVFARMPGDKAQVGLRRRDESGVWHYGPVRIRIRNAEGRPLWTRHPTQDIAVIALPTGVATDTIDAAELPGGRALERLHVRPGDVMMALGYPRGYSANAAGFPILRAGRVASYPLSPASRYPTYLLDFNVFAGNSGGPVYAVRQERSGNGKELETVVLTGILTQQLKASGDRLAIGNVTQADFIAETLDLAAGQTATEVTPDSEIAKQADREPVGALAPRTARQRLAAAWREFWQDGSVLALRAWVVVRDWLLERTTHDAQRVRTS